MATARERPRVLFLCTGNSCRSQMAEGWARAIMGSRVEAVSAGTQPATLNPLAVRAMAEAGVDISGHRPKPIGEVTGRPIDAVVTVCDAASQTCPQLPGVKTIHAPFDDPPRLAAGEPDDERAMVHYRRVRDEIRAFIHTLARSLPDVLPDSQPDMLPDCSRNTFSGDSAMTKRSCCDDSCCTPSNVATATSSPLSNTPSAAPPASPVPVATDGDAMRDQVREGYAKIAQGGCCGPSGGGCCGAVTFRPEDLAKAIGYAGSELSAVPEGANLGLSCGNPTAIASLKPGEVVLDLGSGGGFDCFVAGPKVGRTGRVIGVDMTPDMLTRARRNLSTYRSQTGLDNVEFRLGEIESLPVADASVDVVISNCVLNLSPDKPRVWSEIARVLKPGGRVAVSDLALVRPLPDAVKADVEALVGCVAGAVLVEETSAMAQAAGLGQIKLTPKPEYIDAMTNWEDPLYRAVIAKLPAGSKPSDYITSLDVSAVKP